MLNALHTCGAFLCPNVYGKFKFPQNLLKFLSNPKVFSFGLDRVNGALSASFPWLFGFAPEGYIPHLSFGILESMVVLTREQNLYTTELI